MTDQNKGLSNANKINETLNDIWIFYEYARDTIGASLDAEDDTLKLDDEVELKHMVPHRKDSTKDSTITRSAEQTMKINLFYSGIGLNRMVLVYMISQYEAFISKAIRLAIQSDNTLIKISVKGNEGNKTLSFDDIINLTDKSAIVDKMIDDKIHALMYAKPEDQLKYLSSILKNEKIHSEGLPYLEIKATRDILVHNGSIANSLYVEKSGALARAKNKGKLTVDSDYLRQCVSVMKKLAFSIGVKNKVVGPAK